MPQGSQARLDALARERGFPDYATWKAWNEKNRQVRRPQGEAQAAPQERNFLQSLLARIPWHPANTLDHTNRRMEEGLRNRRRPR